MASRRLEFRFKVFSSGELAAFLRRLGESLYPTGHLLRISRYRTLADGTESGAEELSIGLTEHLCDLRIEEQVLFAGISKPDENGKFDYITRCTLQLFANSSGGIGINLDAPEIAQLNQIQEKLRTELSLEQVQPHRTNSENDTSTPAIPPAAATPARVTNLASAQSSQGIIQSREVPNNPHARRDWIGILTALVSLAALVLSQFPPIKDWIRHEEINVSLSDRIGISQDFGVVSFMCQLDVVNQGNIPLTLSKVSLKVVNPDKTTTELKADSYISLKPSATSGSPMSVSLPLTSIRLKPSETWSEMILLSPDGNPELEERINRAKLSIAAPLYSEQYDARANMDLKAYPQGDFSDFNKLFEENFSLQQGEYQLELKLIAEGGRQLLKHDYRMTIYKFHIETLRSQVDDYKFGAGIILPPNPAKTPWIKIELKGI